MSASGEPGVSKPSGDPYVVVARRYRPRSFSELVGQSHVVQALINAIETDRVGHAYLFTGARGVGKTSTARIFAKALNAPEGPTPYPDNSSDICRRIDAGDDMDVLEIDGASNRGIDEIRQLRAGANVRPGRARYKIYIIDEVHMLTPPAFNALLKTLEEPPPHVKFIFCTTDPDKIPITVLSRCQRFDFAPVDVALLVDRLEQILRQEQREADPEAVRLIAHHASGSVRDSQSLLEQLLAFAPGRLTVDAVHAMLGTAPDARLAAILNALATFDIASSLGVVHEALADGIDPSQLCEQLMQCFRDALLMACGSRPDLLQYRGGEIEAALQAIRTTFDVPTLLAALQVLDHTLTRIRHSTQARTLVEMALVRLGHLQQLASVAELMAGDGADGAGAWRRGVSNVGAKAGGPARPSPSAPRPASAAPQAAAPPAGGDDRPRSAAATEPRAASENDAPHNGGAPDTGTVSVDMSHHDPADIWQQALDRLDDPVVPYASKGKPVRWEAPNLLVVEFPREYTLHKERCERPSSCSAIEAAVQEVTGGPVRLELVVGEAADSPEETPSVNAYELRRERERNPLVQEAVELFDAEVTRIDEPPRRR